MLHPDLLEPLARDRQQRLRAAADSRRLAAVARPKRRRSLSSLAVGRLGRAAWAWRPRRVAVDPRLTVPTNRPTASSDCATC